MRTDRPANGPDRLLAGLAAALAVLIAAYVILGPLFIGAIQLRTSPAAIRQVRGGDVAALVAVLPACLLGSWLAIRGRVAAPVVALGPAVFAVYTYSQIFLGSDYALYPGNVERFAPLFGAIVVLAFVLAIVAWGRIDDERAMAAPAALRHGVGWLLLIIAVFVVFGIHASGLIDAMQAHPSSTAYLEAPTAFWIVKAWDLAGVVPVAVAVGIALLQGRAWATKAMFGMLEGFTLLALSVCGMAAVMYVEGDPSSSSGLVGVTAVLALAGLGFLVSNVRRYESACLAPKVTNDLGAAGLQSLSPKPAGHEAETTGTNTKAGV